MNGASLALRLHPDDSIAIARQLLLGGTVLLEYPGVVASGDIPAAHKIAIDDVQQGQPVRRYGQIIGFATRSIRKSEHVHTQNLTRGAFDRD